MVHAALSGLLLQLSVRGELPGVVACFALVPLGLALCDAESPLRAGVLTAIAQLGVLMAAFEGSLPAIPWTFPLLLLLALPGAMLPGFLYGLSRSRFPGGMTGASLWSLPFSWTATEFLSSSRDLWGQLASPVSLGYSQYGGPLMPIAALAGVTGVTLAVLAVNVSLTHFLLSRRFAPLLATSLVAAVCIVAGATATDGGATGTVGIVQPALPSDWYDLQPRLDEAGEVIVTRLVDLATEVAEADLVVLPEGALPDGAGQDLAKRLRFFRHDDLSLLSGRVGSREGERYNSVVHISASGAERVFDKLAPVPLGEAGIRPGRSFTVGSWGGFWSAPLICLDSLYPRFSRRLVRLGADLLVVVSDDSFAKEFATPRLHMRASAFRAVETGVPLVFASAHGPSAAFGPRGELLARTQGGAPAAMLVEVPPAAPATLYLRFGDFAGFVALTVTALLALALVMRR